MLEKPRELQLKIPAVISLEDHVDMIKVRAKGDLVSLFIPVSCSDSVFTVTSIYMSCKKLAEVLGWAS